MGEQRNLTEENVDILKEQLEKMKTDNPDLEYRFFKQDVPKVSVDMSMILEKIEALDKKIDRIFGDYVLLDGKFQDLSDLEDIPSGKKVVL